MRLGVSVVGADREHHLVADERVPRNPMGEVLPLVLRFNWPGMHLPFGWPAADAAPVR